MNKNQIYIDEYAFKMANIQLTDEQKQAIANLEIAFKNVSELMISVMREQTAIFGEVVKSLLTTVNQHDKDYTQKHKPWKKERFYH